MCSIRAEEPRQGRSRGKHKEFADFLAKREVVCFEGLSGSEPCPARLGAAQGLELGRLGWKEGKMDICSIWAGEELRPWLGWLEHAACV